MPTDLVDYAQRAFPSHDIARWRDGTAGLVLQPHTLVVHVVGTSPAAAVLALAEYVAGDDRVGAVIVKGREPTIIPSADGIVDLPAKRVVAAAALGAVLGMALGTFIGAAATSSVAPTLVIGIFAAIVGGVVGAVGGGGARYGSERANSQPSAAGRDIAIVAAFFDDEHAAASLARTVAETQQQYDIRIVSTDGSWHTPKS